MDFDCDILFLWHRYSNPFPFFQTRIPLNKDIDPVLLFLFYLQFVFQFSLFFVLC